MKSFQSFLSVFIFLSSFFLTSSAVAVQTSAEAVVLLHGLGRSKTTMLPIALYLEHKGYKVINIDYASREKTIESLVEDIGKAILAEEPESFGKLHFIGYSMGGLVARAYIQKKKPSNLGRVVLIGTPNQGSEVADFLRDFKFYQAYFGPAGQQLTTYSRDDLKAILGPVEYEVGVVAGKMSIDPFSSLLLIPGDDDGKVSVERTKVDGMRDFITLNTTHTFMLNNPWVISQAAYFVRNGKFDHADTPTETPVYND